MVSYKLTIRTLAVLTAWLLQPTVASSAALGAPDQSASGLGVANAMTASADDASATVYNPAAIAWLPGTHFMAGSILRWRNAGYNPAGALKNSGINTGHAYLTQMKHGDRLGASLGWNMPLAVNNNWSNYGRTSIRVNRISASLITTIDSTLAIAIGPDWYFGNIDLTNTAGKSFSGSSHNALGGHISAMWKPWPSWSFGAVYRSGASLRFSGNNGTAKVKLPDSARVGVAYRLRNNIRLEIDGRWTHWKKLSQLSAYSNTGALVIGHNLALRDTFDVMTGLTWNWRQDTRFRFGYAFEQGAAKSSNFDPAVTDLSGHRISLGAGSDLFGVHIDAAYSYMFQPSTTTTGIAGSGKLSHRRQSLGISISQYF